MKKVKEEPTLLTCELENLLPKVDFADTFSTTNHQDNMEEIVDRIFNNRSKWVNSLLVLRNKIVGFLGLKNTLPQGYREAFEVGAYISFFRVFSITDKEVILGLDDSHLNFRAIVNNSLTSQYNIKVITLVEYNNLMGKIYMTIVKPFHKLVLRSMVIKAYSQKRT